LEVEDIWDINSFELFLFREKRLLEEFKLEVYKSLELFLEIVKRLLELLIRLSFKFDICNLN
jgi:hypothetical protein